MIVRIVKMKFRPESIDQFFELFDSVNSQIANFEGCAGMMLLRDKIDSNCCFTYSIWRSEEALDNYRKSKLFKQVWPQTKAHFAAPAKAWSTTTHYSSFTVLPFLQQNEES